MDTDLDALVVKNNEARSRFEITVGSDVAELAYELEADRIIFDHTGVPKALEGRGIAGKLAEHGLEYAREHHLGVVPHCPYVASYIKRHPEYQDLVVPG